MLNDDEIQLLQTEFTVADNDGDGMINAEQMQQMFTRLGFSHSIEETRTIVQQISRHDEISFLQVMVFFKKQKQREGRYHCLWSTQNDLLSCFSQCTGARITRVNSESRSATNTPTNSAGPPAVSSPRPLLALVASPTVPKNLGGPSNPKLPRVPTLVTNLVSSAPITSPRRSGSGRDEFSSQLVRF
jgi:hypothetical protein